MGAHGQPALCLPEPRLRSRPWFGHRLAFSLLRPGTADIPGKWPEDSLPCAGYGLARPTELAGLPASDQPFLHLQFSQIYSLAMPGPSPSTLGGAHVQCPGSTTHPFFLTSVASYKAKILGPPHSGRQLYALLVPQQALLILNFPLLPVPGLSPKEGPSLSQEGGSSSCLFSHVHKKQSQHQDWWVPTTL